MRLLYHGGIKTTEEARFSAAGGCASGAEPPIIKLGGGEI